MVASNLTTKDTQDLHGVFEEIVNALIQSAAEHFETKAGGKIKASDKLKLSMARKVFDLSKKFNSETKIVKMIEVTNKVVPILSDYVEDDVILKKVPPQYRDAKTITLLDKAGAKELSNLFRKIQPELAASMVVVPVAVVAAPVAAPVAVALTPALLPVEIVVAEEPVAPVVEEPEYVSPLTTTGKVESTLGRRVESTLTRPIASTVGTPVPSTVSASRRRGNPRPE